MSASEVFDTEEMDNAMRASPNNEAVVTFGRLPQRPVRVAASPTSENVSLRRKQAARITDIRMMVSFHEYGMVDVAQFCNLRRRHSRMTSLWRAILRFIRTRGMTRKSNRR
jgi:hypothetical protein